MKQGTWKLPPGMWAGRTVAVMCGGESMTQAAADAVRAAGLPTIVVNTTFRLAPWADLLYAADAAWWRHTPDALKFRGLKVSMEEVEGVHQVGRVGRVGYDLKPEGIYTLCNSGAQALQIAEKGEPGRILLLAMDMTGSHWHGDHPFPLQKTHEDTYGVWRDYMGQYAAAVVARGGPEILNCSMVSALTCWPKVELADALARAVADPERAELPG